MFSQHDSHWIARANDHLRTFRMNALYYEERLRRVQSQNFLLELLIAIGASTGAGAGLTARFGEIDQLLLKIAEYIWLMITPLAALAAAVKPVLGLGSKIERLSAAQGRYQAAFLRMERVLASVRRSQELQPKHANELEELEFEREKLATLDETPARQRILKWAQEATNEQLPPDRLWVPEPSSSSPLEFRARQADSIA